MLRREFVKTVAVGTGAMLMNGAGASKARAEERSLPGISKIKKPIAIAMWDFSWLLRHYPAGEFEDWDRVLDGLAERGYNAIRMDAFPHQVAADPEGKVQEEFYYPKNNWHPAMWGNNYTMYSRPREGLLEFLPKCRARNIRVGLATWFMAYTEKIKGLEGFVRVWDETLRFVEQHGLLDNVLYVDVLNEYPLFHGFNWLKEKLEAIKDAKLEEVVPVGENKEGANQWKAVGGVYNEVQRSYYKHFMTEALKKLAEKWPGLDFFASQTFNPAVAWQDMDYSQFAAMDVHFWFMMNEKLHGGTGYWKNIHNISSCPNDLEFAEVQKKVMGNWQANKAELVEWMENNVREVAEISKKLKIPCGNTEGWGPINWLDHPALTWDLVKEAGEMCARLGAKYGYMFNCSSNFTHPQFPRLWNDVKWHQKVTSIIRNG